MTRRTARDGAADPPAGPQPHGPDCGEHQGQFDRRNRERFDAAPVCERCKAGPPTDIMRYTAYCAVCRACRDFLLADIARCIDELNREREGD